MSGGRKIAIGAAWVTGLGVATFRGPVARADEGLQIGSKRFTESYILGEVLKRAADTAGETTAVHRAGLGNTGIVLAALEAGGIDVYVEYTGTIRREILRTPGDTSLAALNEGLAQRRLQAGIPLGFENTYALAMREDAAARASVSTLSDLGRHPELRLGFSHEFLERQDGFPALQRAYPMPPKAPVALDHGLAYEALENGQVDVVDAYSTDAKIDRYHLRVLVDDRHFFPEYQAVLLYRQDLPTRLPRTWKALSALEGTVPAARMRAMNAAAEIDGMSFAAVAAQPASATRSPAAPSKAFVPAGSPRTFLGLLFGPDLGRLSLQHVFLVAASLAMAVVAGIPLGILAARRRTVGAVVLAAAGVVQTIPSLALLAFLIPMLQQIGTLPTLIALFLYSLLPIVRGTQAGLLDIPAPLRESADAISLPPVARLRWIELPLSARSILAGIKTAAVIGVGTATLAAFVGAGGFGERIATGLALNDSALLLAGAIPAAALALLVQGGFALLERWAIPGPVAQRSSRTRS